MTDQPPLPRPAHLRRPGLVPDITLVEFLAARLDEDEQAARTAEDGDRWSVNSEDDVYSGPAPVAVGPWGGGVGYAAEHIARHDPARVLAEVEAKRAIIDAYLEERSRRDIYQSADARAAEDTEQATRRRSSAARCRGLEIAVERLALPYAGHPDYRAEEWAV